MSHDNFGHMGQNKMADHIRKYFYWPSITADSMLHIRSCDKCQKCDKTHPKRMVMQEREIVIIPSERVAIDLMGPFPVARGVLDSLSPTWTWRPGGLRQSPLGTP